MKVLHVREEARAASAIELHPQITLVRNLDPTRRAWLVEVLSRLAGGQGLAAVGEIEAHGIRFDLDDQSLALVGFHHEVEAVVTAADLPGFDPAGVKADHAVLDAVRTRDDLIRQLHEHRVALAAAVEERDAAARALDGSARGEDDARDRIAAWKTDHSKLELELRAARDERIGNEEDLAWAVESRQAVVTERSSLRNRLDIAQDQRRDAMTAATQAAAAVEQTRSGAAPNGQAAHVASARAQLEAAESAAQADGDIGDHPLNRRLTDLERRRDELSRLESAMGEGGSEEVAWALDDLLGASPEAPPMAAAAALADTWRDLHQQVDVLEEGVSEEERVAEDRVAAVRQTVTLAEAEFNRPTLSPEQILKVEAAHTAVLDCQDRAESRFGGSRARKRLEELRADERRVLDRMGFTTYADYLLSSSGQGVGPANRAILETARVNLAEAERQLTLLPGAVDRARRQAELVERREAVAPWVAELIGHHPSGPEAEDELRSLREPDGADHDALEELASRLRDAGINMGPAPHAREELVLQAQAYLADERSAEAQRNLVTKAIGALNTTIDDLRAASDRGETEAPELPKLPEMAEPVVRGTDEAARPDPREIRRADVESARAALADAEAASAYLEALEVALVDATSAEAKAAAAVAEAEAALGPAIQTRIVNAARRVTEAEAAVVWSRLNEEEAIARITVSQAASGAEHLPAGDQLAEARQQLDEAETAVTGLVASEQAVAVALASAEDAVEAGLAVQQAARTAAAGVDRSQLVDDIDWQLLNRLAQVRGLGPGGSVPLVLDDPFGALDDREATLVLDRLAQIAGAVQVVVISDREAMATWAAGRGPARVGVHAA